jgi:hypothetical protein
MRWWVRAFCALAVVLVSAPLAPAQDPSAASPTAAASPPAAPPAPLTADQIRSRERLALVSLSTVLLAQRTYAGMNGSFFDSMTCLMQPGECLPGQKDAAPLIDPGYHWLEPRLGYVMRFHPGPGATPDEISKSGASPSSIKAYAVTLTPEHPGLTGGRAFCGDSSGKMCFTDGAPPPVKDGRCEPCKKLQ